jgi:hypothetical protein
MKRATVESSAGDRDGGSGHPTFWNGRCRDWHGERPVHTGVLCRRLAVNALDNLPSSRVRSAPMASSTRLSFRNGWRNSRTVPDRLHGVPYGRHGNGLPKLRANDDRLRLRPPRRPFKSAPVTRCHAIVGTAQGIAGRQFVAPLQGAHSWCRPSWGLRPQAIVCHPSGVGPHPGSGT